MSSKPKQKENPKIGITIGDINGVGPEVIMKALGDSRLLNHITPVIYGSTKALSYYRKSLRIEEFNYSQVKKPGEFFIRKVNVVNCWNDMIDINAGTISQDTGRASFLALKKCVEDLKEGIIDGVVTAPINKHNIQNDEFKFPGHTEFFTEQFESEDSLMLMASEDLRVGVVTGHVALSQVSKKITEPTLKSKINIMLKSLKEDFAIGKPKIAVLGLNPHAGEQGLLGTEEQDVIRPVVESFKADGKLVFGPFPADGFFGQKEYKKFDGVLAMYHDQGLIPFKTIAFEHGVNYTAGLSVVRTSPDHGTAYSIAGKNEASPVSMREAIYMAYDIIRNRQSE